jgi:hypothetical protein
MPKKAGSLAARFYNSSKNQMNNEESSYPIVSATIGRVNFHAIDTQSDEKNSSNTLVVSSEKESRGEY